MSRSLDALALAADRLDPPAVDVFGRLGYEPTPRQQLFHQATEFDVFYGGAAGGGKTRTLLMEGIRAGIRHPGLRVGAFRRTMDEHAESFLRELQLIDYARVLGCRWNGTTYELRFPNSSVIRFRYLERVDDATRRQGGEYQLVLIDERTLILPEAVSIVVDERLRSGRVGLPVIGVRSASNPGGIGHADVKGRYIDATNYGLTTYTDEQGRTVRCIPAKVSDNPHIAAADPGYIRRLDAIPDPGRRAAMRDGSWDVFSGMAFPAWNRDVHVVDPQDWPITLGLGVRRGLAIDYGLDAPFCALWGAVFPDNLVVIYREVYQTELTPTQQAELILASEAPGERDDVRRIPAWLDPSCFNRQPTSPKPTRPGAAPRDSIADMYQRAGLPVQRANNDRRVGFAVVSEALRIRADGRPRLLIYATCPNLIRTLPSLPRDPANPEDVNTAAEDHPYDTTKYLLLGLGLRPQASTYPGSGTRDVPRNVTAALARSGF